MPAQLPPINETNIRHLKMSVKSDNYLDICKIPAKLSVSVYIPNCGNSLVRIATTKLVGTPVPTSSVGTPSTTMLVGTTA